VEGASLMFGALPDPAQWTGDLFWSQIQWVANQGRQIKSRLDAQKLDLQRTYTAARNANDEEKKAKLEPLIHRNSELRVQYMNLATKFNDIVEKARYWLGQHGIDEPPTLAGLGALPALPVIWVVALIGVIGLVYAITGAINAIDKALRDLGPVGAGAISFAVLGAVGLVIYLLAIKPMRSTRA
jgi:hypothetical protein